MTIVAAAGAVTADGLVEPAWLEVSGEAVTAVGSGGPPRPPDVDMGAACLVPGFVDIHVHGGAGTSFDGGAAAAERAADFHRRHGTTTLLASLVTAPLDELEASIRALADLVAHGTVAGVHLEGPFLSPSRCGAHDPALLRDPGGAELSRLLDAGGGAVRMVTVAPELAGGIEAVRRIAGAGGGAAGGPARAAHPPPPAAVEAGARAATHLFSAMPPVHHRNPGPVVALLEDPRVVVELINDGVHLHPAVARTAAAAAGTARTALVTDATAAAGMGEGRFRLGPLEVEVCDGVARLVEGGALAGGTATMAEVFRRTAGDLGIEAAAAMAATTPARLLAREDIGVLATGRRADLVAVDHGYRVVAVMHAGTWLDEAAA
jgi:N-acetylglucosamine-6-phosphate deacetylase